MATLEEIARRVEHTDNPRTAKRLATAQRVAELAGRRAGIVAELDEVERQLGDVLVDAEDVIGDDELARFTDVDRADLARWRAAARTARKATQRGKRTRKSTEDGRVDGVVEDRTSRVTPAAANGRSANATSPSPAAGPTGGQRPAVIGERVEQPVS